MSLGIRFVIGVVETDGRRDIAFQPATSGDLARLIHRCTSHDAKRATFLLEEQA